MTWVLGIGLSSVYSDTWWAEKTQDLVNVSSRVVDFPCYDCVPAKTLNVPTKLCVGTRLGRAVDLKKFDMNYC